MVFVPRPRIEKFRNLFLLVFLILVVTIILTPLLVRRGFYLFAEETLEAILLFIQVSLAWHIFRLYEKAVIKREEEVKKLESEYRKREKELIETFTYLGKLNVQVSLIKSFLQKLKAPANRKEVKEYTEDILRMALAISKRNWMTVRIINIANTQTVSEYWVRSSGEPEKGEIKIGNKYIIEMTKNRNMCNEKGHCILSSAGSVVYEEKAFLIFNQGGDVDQEVLEFLKAAVNQCDIIHTLYVLGHGQK